MSAENDNTPDYSMLTEEEIEAIGAEPSPDELVTMRQAEEAENLEDDEEDEIVDQDEKTTPPGKAEAAETSVQTEAVEQAISKAKPDTLFQANLPEDFQQQLDDIETKKTELRQKLNDGDIDFDEYEKSREELSLQERKLDRQLVKAEIARDIEEQSAQKTWENTVQSFLDSSAKAGLDYRADNAKRNDLDLYVKTLAANPANAEKSMSWFVETADRMVRAQYGITTTQPKPNKQQNSRRQSLDELPTTLAHVSGADDVSESEGKFADLDKLDGLALETALARLSPDQRNEYLQGG